MSTLDAILQGIKTNSSNSTNLCVRVDLWEDNQVKGIRLDTNEEVVVRLNNYEKKTDAPFDRPTLNSLKEKKRCKSGAVILFEQCIYNESDGFWLSRWANLIKKSDGDKKNTVALLRAKVFIGKSPRSQKEYIEIKALGRHDKAISSENISSIEELYAIANKYLIPVGKGATPYLIVHANDGEKTFTFEIKASIIESNINGEISFSIDPNPENSINKYLESRYGDVLKSCINHTEIVKTVSHGKAIYCGTATRDATLKGNKGAFLKKEFMINKEDHYAADNLGYKTVVVCIRDDVELNSKYAVFVSTLKPYDLPDSFDTLIM